jgi:type I restriction-modification system DNA methylase subunit
MDILGRYYTDTVFSELLVKHLNMPDPRHILDLGVGDGSLLSAAFNKWQNANFSAVDIEEKNFTDCPRIKFFRNDVLNNSGEITLELLSTEIDIAICNPPYSRIIDKSKYVGLFDEIGFKTCQNLKYITADLLFLAFNLSLLKKGGQLGIIVPDTLITSSDFELFRVDILKYDICAIIELPVNVFKKTEAKTYIIVLNNNMSKSSSTELLCADKNGVIIDKIKLLKSSLIKRMDYTFHSFKSKNTVPGITLREIGAEICRGRLSKKELIKKGASFFHTSSFNTQSFVSFPEIEYGQDGCFAKKNDILIARVGSRCIGKFCFVKNGMIEISDCIFKVTLPDEYTIPFLNALSSEYAKAWFKANSHGVCAKLINKNDLLDFKIPL